MRPSCCGPDCHEEVSFVRHVALSHTQEARRGARHICDSVPRLLDRRTSDVEEVDIHRCQTRDALANRADRWLVKKMSRVRASQCIAREAFALIKPYSESSRMSHVPREIREKRSEKS